MSIINYRKDINGLRAVAVLPVLFFHSEWEYFSGGFLGVDVFFVISGFLITSIIIRELEEQSFSVLRFFDRRIRRIIPALLVVSLLTTILSFFLMLPYDHKNYGQSLVATVFSANNILLYLTSGYWSLAAEFKPLYHTWSLAVEGQFYILLPVILVFIYRIAEKSFATSILFVVILASISFSVSVISNDQEFNFLIISHRIWELLMGAFVAIYLYKYKIANNSFLAIIGLVLIILSFINPYFISDRQAIYNLVPIIGSVIVIMFSSNHSLSGKILSIKPLSVLGTLSYSIYLVHMPILAFLRLNTEGNPGVLNQLMYVSISIPVAYFLWRYVEIIFRDHTRINIKLFYYTQIALALFLVGTGYILHKSYGLQQFYPQYSYGNNPQRYAAIPFKFTKEEFTDKNKKNLLIIGNSFARDFANMMLENRIADTYELIYIFDPTVDEELSRKLINAADITIAVSSAGMLSKLEPEILKNKSKWLYEFVKENSVGEFYMIGTKNFGWNNNFIRSIEPDIAVDYKVQINKTTLDANKIEKQIWKKHYIDIISVLADKENKTKIFTPNGRFISFDTEHLTKDGAIYLGHILLESTVLKNVFKT